MINVEIVSNLRLLITCELDHLLQTAFYSLGPEMHSGIYQFCSKVLISALCKVVSPQNFQCYCNNAPVFTAVDCQVFTKDKLLVEPQKRVLDFFY